MRAAANFVVAVGIGCAIYFIAAKQALRRLWQ